MDYQIESININQIIDIFNRQLKIENLLKTNIRLYNIYEKLKEPVIPLRIRYI